MKRKSKKSLKAKEGKENQDRAVTSDGRRLLCSKQTYKRYVLTKHQWCDQAHSCAANLSMQENIARKYIATRCKKVRVIERDACYGGVGHQGPDADDAIRNVSAAIDRCTYEINGPRAPQNARRLSAIR